MLLNNPDLCRKPHLRKKLVEFKKKNNIPSRLECVVFNSRDDADHWMQLRHEGQQEGIGTKGWDADQKARYSDKMGRISPNIQAVKLLDYAQDEKIITADEVKNISITTLTRYLSNPVFRNIFGLRDNKALESNQDEDSFKLKI